MTDHGLLAVMRNLTLRAEREPGGPTLEQVEAAQEAWETYAFDHRLCYSCGNPSLDWAAFCRRCIRHTAVWTPELEQRLQEDHQ